MQLSTILKKGKKYSTRKRVGRGVGSGLGKTSGRGHKGWGQRSGARRRSGYEGGQMPLYRRVPKRGFKNARFRTDYTVINVDQLNGYAAGTTVDLETVLASGLVSLETRLLKVLGDGDLNRALTVRAQKFSKSALEKIQAAGGKAVLLDAFGREAKAE
jgi:large subunit ribosomal protein L15